MKVFPSTLSKKFEWKKRKSYFSEQSEKIKIRECNLHEGKKRVFLIEKNVTTFSPQSFSFFLLFYLKFTHKST